MRKSDDTIKQAKQEAELMQLTLIGKKIDIACKCLTDGLQNEDKQVLFLGILAGGITRAELEKFSEYLSEQEATMPMFHPTEYQFGGDADALKAARKRVDALLAFWAVYEA